MRFVHSVFFFTNPCRLLIKAKKYFQIFLRIHFCSQKVLTKYKFSLFSAYYNAEKLAFWQHKLEKVKAF
jgi:hypothetical protein